MQRATTVDEYLDNAGQWQDELRTLRDILRSTDLAEEVKWGAPCYTEQGKNVVGIGGFKSYFGLWFHQGALLADKAGVLINAQEGKTKALRQWRMQTADDIDADLIRQYVAEARALVHAGKSITPSAPRPLELPPELRAAFDENREAAKEFDRLRPGLKREYAEYVADARRADTKQRRIEKILPMIIAGVGLNDRYRR